MNMRAEEGALDTAGGTGDRQGRTFPVPYREESYIMGDLRLQCTQLQGSRYSSV